MSELHTLEPTTTNKIGLWHYDHCPDSKVHGANMGPISGQQGPGVPHVGPGHEPCYLGGYYIKTGPDLQSMAIVNGMNFRPSIHEHSIINAIWLVAFAGLRWNLVHHLRVLY